MDIKVKYPSWMLPEWLILTVSLVFNGTNKILYRSGFVKVKIVWLGRKRHQFHHLVGPFSCFTQILNISVCSFSYTLFLLSSINLLYLCSVFYTTTQYNSDIKGAFSFQKSWRNTWKCSPCSHPIDNEVLSFVH